MKAILIPAAAGLLALAAIAAPGPAQAKGCIKGAIVGGVAGHYAGHHGLLGAGAGCVIGRHEANRQARERAQQERAQQQQYDNRAYREGYGSSAPAPGGYYDNNGYNNGAYGR